MNDGPERASWRLQPASRVCLSHALSVHGYIGEPSTNIMFDRTSTTERY